jgi:redox-sensitive bicupin YhaK (pirin superfamily)
MRFVSFSLFQPKLHDLGGFQVRRVLPQLRARHIGPFVFFDHMGPAQFAPGHGVDVRPHPHIGLATVTYLFCGAIEHRDNLGSVQTIRPGDVNWMTAGRGIVHSERSPAAERTAGDVLHGIQTWVALPQHAEEVEPSFHHHPGRSLPRFEHGDAALTLIAGSAFEQTSPVITFSKMFYLAAEIPAGGRLRLPAEHVERAVYATDAALTIDGTELPAMHLAVLTPGAEVEIRAAQTANVLLCGGDPLDGERHLYWNFVSSSRERIDRAKSDWQAMRFPRIPGETEFIPLPDY